MTLVVRSGLRSVERELDWVIKLRLVERYQAKHGLPLDDPRLIQHNGSVEQLAAFGLRPAA